MSYEGSHIGCSVVETAASNSARMSDLPAPSQTKTMLPNLFSLIPLSDNDSVPYHTGLGRL